MIGSWSSDKIVTLVMSCNLGPKMAAVLRMQELEFSHTQIWVNLRIKRGDVQIH